jgi:peroxiredoxin Q/BCP
MAQLRDDYEQLEAMDSEVVVVGPDSPKAFRRYWQKHRLPFVGLPDPSHGVLKRYGQEVRLFKLGRMPAQVLVDRQGVARFVHYGHSMMDIPKTDDIILLLERINNDK